MEDRAGKVPPSGDQDTQSRPALRTYGQWLMLVRRNLVLKVRDRAQLIILLLQAPLFAVLIAMVYSMIKEPASGVNPSFRRRCRLSAKWEPTLSDWNF